jgi:hypothetical protein
VSSWCVQAQLNLSTAFVVVTLLCDPNHFKTVATLLCNESLKSIILMWENLEFLLSVHSLADCWKR